MRAALRSSDPSYALQAYDEIKSDLVKNSSLQLKNNMYYELVDHCAKNGLWRRGLDIVSDMEKAGQVPSIKVYNSLLRYFDPSKNVRSLSFSRLYAYSLFIAQAGGGQRSCKDHAH